MKLTQTIYQEKDGQPFQCLEITIDYLSSINTVNEVVSITAFEFGKERIDLSDIFMKHFEKDLEKIITETDWRRLYRETVIQQTEMIDE